MNSADEFMDAALSARKEAGNYRVLRNGAALVDLCSNDYLGFARSAVLKQYIDDELNRISPVLNGSGGSRLLSGNTSYAEELESGLALFHGFESGLLYNSGYDANLGLFSALPQRGDTVITDELAHASIIDGIRLSYANRYSFRHNDMYSLEEKLKQARGRIYIAVESVYSMDGDTAPLKAICALARQYHAGLIVDEAHATGVFGRGMVDEQGLQRQVFAKVITFGKALGCHGAAVLGSSLLKNYLVNFSRSFIYTTAAPLHQLAAIKMAYRLLGQADAERAKLKKNIHSFKKYINTTFEMVPSDSPIQCLLLGSNEKAKNMAALAQAAGFDVRPILSPTVAAGAERLRICIHAYNTTDELQRLASIINNAGL